MLEDDYNGRLIERDGRLFIAHAIQFNRQLLPIQQAILDLYKVKSREQAFSDPDDFLRNIELTTEAYLGQLASFNDALRRKGYSPTESVLAGADTCVAMLTHFGTLVMLGKPKWPGGERPLRMVSMARLHNPELNKNDGSKGYIDGDLELGQRAQVWTTAEGFDTSTLRGLAVNPNGVDGTETEEMAGLTNTMSMLVTGIGTKTMEMLMKPRQK